MGYLLILIFEIRENPLFNQSHYDALFVIQSKWVHYLQFNHGRVLYGFNQSQKNTLFVNQSQKEILLLTNHRRIFYCEPITVGYSIC